MAKAKRFGRVYHTAQSGDGEESVSESLRQNTKDARVEETNNDCEVFQDEDGSDFKNEEEIDICVEEEDVEYLGEQFGDFAREQIGDKSDEDSGDDIWNDDTIPDPLSSYDDEEVLEHTEEVANTKCTTRKHTHYYDIL